MKERITNNQLEKALQVLVKNVGLKNAIIEKTPMRTYRITEINPENGGNSNPFGSQSYTKRELLNAINLVNDAFYLKERRN